MAVTSIDIAQDNFVNGSNLLTVHNPLVFLVDANYTGDIPDYILVEVADKDDVLLGTFRCIYESDITATARRFMFIADEILKGFMGLFDDTIQGGLTLEYVEGITMQFKLNFTDNAGGNDRLLEITAIHASSQFGSYPNLDRIFNNEQKEYEGFEGKPCYVYFYNDNEANVLSITETQLSVVATDSDDEDLTDSDDVLLEIIIPA